MDNPWRYSGKRYDAETGFFYFGYRYYAPEIGRWITPDPAGFVDGPNLYGYIHNRPLFYIDPDGRILVPLLWMGVSIAFDYYLPVGIALAEPYIGATAVNFLLTVHQVNNLDVMALNFAEQPGSTCAGVAVGLGYKVFSASKSAAKGGYSVIQNAIGTAGQETAVAASEGFIKRNCNRFVYWFKGSTEGQIANQTQKVASIAEKRIVTKAAPSQRLPTATSQVPTDYMPYTKDYYRHNLKKFTNQSPSRNIDAHHIFPQKFRKEFAETGINIDDPKYLTWWEKVPHRRASRQYQDFWYDFLYYRNPTKEQILDKGREFTIEKGLDVYY